LQNLAIALALLEDDALGGHGSRGYGKVKFAEFQFYFRSLNQYRQIASGESGLPPIQRVANTKELLENFGRFRDEIEQRLLPGNGGEA
jgi:CRISPR-associated protein Csm3